jgi:hypothetical protein
VAAVGFTSGDPRKLNKSGYSKGDVVAANAAGDLTPIPVGADTEVLTADASDAEGVDWEPGGGGGGGGTPSNTVVAETSYGQAATAGAATAYSRGDHTHGTPSLTGTAPATTLGIGQSAALGAATTPARADHVHPLAAAGAPAASAVADTQATGVATTFAASDHRHAREGFGAPAGSAVGDTQSSGAATTVARSDHRHAREAFGAVTAQTSFGAASSDGAATTVARSDHTHGTPAAPAVPSAATTVTAETAYGAASAVGVATTYAREDHTHGSPSLTSATPAAETIGASGVVGVAATPARADHVHAMPAAGTPGSSAVGDSASAGAAATFSRSDHTHGREAFGSVTAETSFGQAVSDGVAATVARSDHTHGTPAAPSVPAAAGTVVTETAFGQSSTAGAAATYSRGDHTHGTPSAAPLDLPQAAPPAPLAGNQRLFAVNDQGFTGLHAIDPTGAVLDLMHDSWLVVRNNSGGTLTKGTVVYFTGVHPGGNTPIVAAAQANAIATMPAVGIIQADIANNSFGRMVHHGDLENVDTSGFNLNDRLYVSAATPGTLTNVRPAHPNYAEVVAFVERVHATQGLIHVTVRAVFGDELGTRSSTWGVGDDTAGAKAVVFKNGQQATLQANPTGTRTVTVPDASGTLVLESRAVNTGTYLTGGGDLSTDRTLDADVGTAAGTLAAGDDSRITGAQQRSTLTTKGDLYAATASATTARQPVGSDGQVLRADSGQATGLAWDTLDAADVGAVANTLADAKGDLIAASGADTWVRLPVGTNGHVLTADSAETAGVKWAAGGGGGSTLVVRRERYTGGDMTLNLGSGAWNLITGPALVIPAAVGDYIELTLSVMVQSGNAYLDPAVVVSGAAVRYASSDTSTPAVEGWPPLYTSPSSFRTAAGPWGFEAVSGDISGGNITFRMAMKGTTGTLYGSTNYPFYWLAKNYGAVDFA